MFIGHYALALAAKRAAPRTSLGTLFAAVSLAGVWLYATATRARDRVGSYGFWALIALLALSYVGSLFSPPPPTRVALATFGIIFGWLFVAWAGWGDRHRESVA